jgi:hypothetical protein
MKVDKVPKGTNKQFARGGKTPMFGKNDRSKSANPASPQKPGRTGQHATKAAPTRTGNIRSAAVDTAGDMGGSSGASQPRRPAA